MSPSLTAKLSTLTVHGDDDVNKIPSGGGVGEGQGGREVADVAPALHVSTTFRYARDPEELVEAKDVDVSFLALFCFPSHAAPCEPLFGISSCYSSC